VSSTERTPVENELKFVLLRGLRRRCPRCGIGELFDSWYGLRPHCGDCGLDYAKLAHDTWALIYVSTAALTGVVIVGVVFLRPFNIVVGRFVLALTAATLIVASLPFRKGMAVALNYFIESRHKPPN
jgi:uncharacterized protein (DUF983 family)